MEEKRKINKLSFTIFQKGGRKEGRKERGKEGKREGKKEEGGGVAIA
jgi:hypothetical protein